MMRPVLLALPPVAPDGLYARLVVKQNGQGTITLTWNDNSISETSYSIERSDNGGAWTQIGVSDSPLAQTNTKGMRMFIDTAINPAASYQYRVIALNTVGDTWNYADPNQNNLVTGGFPNVTVQSAYSNVAVPVLAPAAPTNLVATILTGPQVRLTWTDNATNEANFVIERAVNGGAFTQYATAPARTNTGSVNWTDTAVTLGQTYSYRVYAVTAANVTSFYSNEVTITVGVPSAPTGLTATPVLNPSGTSEKVTLTWTDTSNNENSFTIQWSTDPNFGTFSSATVGRNVQTYTTGNIPHVAWYFRIRATNALGSSAWVTTSQVAPAAAMVLNGMPQPLVFRNGFAMGVMGWTGGMGNVQGAAAAAMGGVDAQGLAANMAMAAASPDAGMGQAAYVYDNTPNSLASYTANFYFNPNDAVTGMNPVDIFLGSDRETTAIFGIQYQHESAASDMYQIRAWAKVDDGSEAYTAWVPVKVGAQNIQLDWTSNKMSVLFLSVDNQVVATLAADTHEYTLDTVRLGPSRGVDSMAPEAASGTMYFDEFISFGSTAGLNTFGFFLPSVQR